MVFRSRTVTYLVEWELAIHQGNTAWVYEASPRLVGQRFDLFIEPTADTFFGPKAHTFA